MDLLDSRQLRAFQELARLGSFTDVAAQLHLTQSAVSHSIKALENQLDTALFERLGKQVRLTPAGEALLPYVNTIMIQMQKAQDEVQIVQRPGYGRLRIGATVSVSQYLLPSILRELRESFPNFEIAVVTEDTQNLINLLENSQIDIAIALESNIPMRFEYTPLFTDQIEMALSPMHPLASIETVTREDISAEEFIFYNRSSETYRLIERIFADLKSKLRASMQVGSMAAIKEMAQIGMGVGLLAPWIALDEISKGTLVFRPLPSDQATRSWGIYQAASSPSSLVNEIFVGICKNVVTTMKLRTENLLERETPMVA